VSTDERGSPEPPGKSTERYSDCERKEQLELMRVGRAAEMGVNNRLPGSESAGRRASKVE